jgi:prophage antirepressor-like protein
MGLDKKKETYRYEDREVLQGKRRRFETVRGKQFNNNIRRNLMNQLKVFENEEFGQVRTVEVNGEPYLVLKDVCEILGIKNATDVTKRLDEEEVTRLNLGGRVGVVNLINESGLYAVVLRSDKPNARKFRKWVTSEVLPSIRKTGAYTGKKLSALEQLNLHNQAILEVNEKVETVKNDLEEFKQELPLLGCDMDRITTAVKKIGVRCLGGKESNAYRDKSLRSKVYADIYDQLKREFGVSTYKSIKRNQCDLAVDIVEMYQLPMVLEEEINDCNAQEVFV